MPDDDSPDHEDFQRALGELLPVVPVVSPSYLAEGVGCTQAEARAWLHGQWSEGELHRRKIGGSTFVYYPSEENTGSTEQPASEAESSKSVEEDTDAGERVLFFPGRREIAVDQPTDDTRESLSGVAHLVDSAADSYLYKIGSGDVWTAAVDSFDELRETLRGVVGDEKWDGGFESRIEDDWRRAHQFELQTETDDAGREFTVLEAEDPETVENVVKRKLEHNEHYTEFLSETEVRLRRGATAAVKEQLYEEGYPAVDSRRIDEGESLDVELVPEISLRDYQQEWIDHFVERKAGVFVGPSGSGKTVAAMGAMAAVGGETLIIVPNRELAGQWQEELLEKTTLERDQIGQYHGGQKRIRPVTIATYDTAAMSRHRELFNEREWGLVVADECFSGDTEVVTESGRTTFAELDDEHGFSEGWTEGVDLSVQTYDPNVGEYHMTEVTGVYKTTAPVQRIATDDGREITATPSHTHLIYNPETAEIEESKTLSEGDWLVYPRSRNVRLSGDYSHPAAELTGWMIGDGSMTDSGAMKFSFAKRPEEQASVVKRLCDALDLDYSTYWNDRGDYTVRVPATDKLPYDGTPGAKTNTVRIPAESYMWSEERVAALVRGLFDAEGWVDEETSRVQIGTTSPGLSQDLRFLLQRLGFDPRSQTLEREEPHADMHRHVLSPEQSWEFVDIVGSRFVHKRENVNSDGGTNRGIPTAGLFESVKTELGVTNETLAEMLGMSRQGVGEAIREEYEYPAQELLGLADGLERLALETLEGAEAKRKHWNISYAELSEASGVDMSYCRKLLEGIHDAPETTERVERALETIVEQRRSAATEYAERIRSLANFGVTRVTDIEPAGEETVYDFETETHTFVADNLLTHNCHHAVANTWKRFREIQSVARLGLSATPVRESGDAKEIFSLIGPPVGQSWSRLFREDWVAEPSVELLLVPWGSDAARTRYERAEGAKKLIEAARNPRKSEVIEELLREHDEEKTLIFVDWIRQGRELSERLGIPFVYGETSHDRRQTIYQQFRDGAMDALIVSRVGDEGLDLPDAEVAILASTMGSSRSQTGQRVGRTMRPMGNAKVYILLTRGSSEEDWGRESTQYLAEKGIDIEKRELDG
ncbi:DEAD/DEAH box helicase family protein [Halobaculum sp. MBLA0143]|uniref:DEAD/DEAH box helicase family protein n=1 Tax=Halobaculum sp. MBLA0143 TaxID=3079933 RepID=UPI00352369E8